MFLLVKTFRVIGMFLNVFAWSGLKQLTKTYNKGFPSHSTLINYGETES